jgi:hypothetical protein
MSVEADSLVQASTAIIRDQGDHVDSQKSASEIYGSPQAQTDSASRSDSGTEHNKPQFIKAHRRGGSYIPGGYSFASTNSKVPLPKSRIEQLGNAFPAKKIEVASLAIKSAAQRTSVLHIERSISSPLPSVSAHMMRPAAGRWRSNNGLYDTDLQWPSNGQYVRPAFTNGERDRFQVGQTKPRTKIQKQNESEESSRRKTVTWCELAEVHEFVHADTQKMEVKTENTEEKANCESRPDKSDDDDKKLRTGDSGAFVKDDPFENQPIEVLDMHKLEIMAPLQLSKCIDSDSDISISSPSSEDSMPFTDVSEAQDIASTPETYQYKRNSRISRDDVLSRLAELKKNRNEDDALEAVNMAKEMSSSNEDDARGDILGIIDPAESYKKNETSLSSANTQGTELTEQINIQQNETPSSSAVTTTTSKPSALCSTNVEGMADSAKVASGSQSVSTELDEPSVYTANMGKATTAKRLDLSEWYKQRKRMERLRREQVQNGKYDFHVNDVNDLADKVLEDSKPTILNENSRRATYTEGINNIIPLTTGRQAGGFEKSLLDDFQRIAEGQKVEYYLKVKWRVHDVNDIWQPKAYREYRRSKVVVASSDFEKAGGADQAIADALAIKANRVSSPIENTDPCDDSAQSIHSIESTANFAPRPWMERRRSTDLLSRLSPDSPARGRLYVQVVAAQDLDFPFPSSKYVRRAA